MAIETINNGEFAASVRNKLNSNFSQGLTLDPANGLQIGGAAPTSTQASAVRAAVGDASPNATHRLLTKLESGQSANIIVCSDSTGVGTDRFIYKIATILAQLYPLLTVQYYDWNDSTKAYNSAVVVQAGEAQTIKIYNGAVAGRQLYHLHGQYFEAAYGVVSADWVVINHGHNHDYNWNAEIHAAALIAGGQQLAMRHPYAGVSIVSQNPQFGNTQGTNRSVGAALAAHVTGWSLIDVFSLYTKNGNPASWWVNDGADTTHPSVTAGGGDDQIAALVYKYLDTRSVAQPTLTSNSLEIASKNLLTNGDFSAFASSVPDGWTAVNCTVSQDSTNYESGAFSAGLLATATHPVLTQTISGGIVRRLRGRFVTISARLYLPTSNTGSVHGPDISSSTDGGTTFSGSNRGWAITNPNGRGGFIWTSTRLFVPSNATHLLIKTPGTGSASGSTLSVDRMILAPGVLPFDMQ